MYVKNLERSDGTELPKICTYCKIWLNGPKIGCYSNGKGNSAGISHGICPDCLLENFPQEYLTIQIENRIRIKHIFKKGYPESNG